METVTLTQILRALVCMQNICMVVLGQGSGVWNSNDWTASKKNYVQKLQKTGERRTRFAELPTTTIKSGDTSTNIMALYKALQHHQDLASPLVHFGDKPIQPVYTDIESHDIQKREAFDIAVAQPACPSKTEWKLLNLAKNINNSIVEIFQPTDESSRHQWFYTVTCDVERMLEENLECPSCCRGVDPRRYSSRCIPRQTYVMAIVRKPMEVTFGWDYIQVDSSCNCAVSSDIYL